MACLAACFNKFCECSAKRVVSRPLLNGQVGETVENSPAVVEFFLFFLLKNLEITDELCCVALFGQEIEVLVEEEPRAAAEENRAAVKLVLEEFLSLVVCVKSYLICQRYA